MIQIRVKLILWIFCSLLWFHINKQTKNTGCVTCRAGNVLVMHFDWLEHWWSEKCKQTLLVVHQVTKIMKYEIIYIACIFSVVYLVLWLSSHPQSKMLFTSQNTAIELLSIAHGIRRRLPFSDALRLVDLAEAHCWILCLNKPHQRWKLFRVCFKRSEHCISENIWKPWRVELFFFFPRGDHVTLVVWFVMCLRNHDSASEEKQNKRFAGITTWERLNMTWLGHTYWKKNKNCLSSMLVISLKFTCAKCLFSI